LKIYLTRDSVCAGDDINPPHHFNFIAPANSNHKSIIEFIIKQRYLTEINGENAIWGIASISPIAIIAQP
jgi:hypothetical protein